MENNEYTLDGVSTELLKAFISYRLLPVVSDEDKKKLVEVLKKYSNCEKLNER